MPAGDQTGPQGLGPLTGRGLGPCRRGFRNFWRKQEYHLVGLSKDEQKKILEAEKQEIDKKLKELD